MRDNKRCVYYVFHILNIPNVRLIITEILAHIAQFPKRIDALIVDIYMNVTKEF
jgi:spermidine synthase